MWLFNNLTRNIICFNISYGLTKNLKAAFPEIKIILSGDYDRQALEESALKAGVDDLVERSDIRGLEEKIKNF